MISRRKLLAVTAVLASAVPLCAQDTRRPAPWVEVRVIVTQGTRYINDLKPSDFRVFEDGILQRIFTFAEGAQPPLLVNDDGTTTPLDAPTAGQADRRGLNLTSSASEDRDHSYTITYSPDPSNKNQGFRKIRIEPDREDARRWALRHKPGYRMERRSPEDQHQ